jgi:hypothetical protein
MLATILGIIILIVAAILVVAATRPDDFRVARSATINAPPQTVFSLINDFHVWPKWSP